MLWGIKEYLGTFVRSDYGHMKANCLVINNYLFI